MRAFAIALLALLAAATVQAETIAVDDGSYAVRVPDGWNEITALPLVVFFHGYGSSGANVIGDERLAALASETGYLLVAPDGRANARGVTSWSHQGSPSQNRDELAFIDAVLADVRGRFPLTDALPVFAGFSQGGSMVWDVACRRGATFGRYVAIAGGFWDPMPARCATPVGVLSHVHGLDDRVVPLEGRPIGDRWHQADILNGLQRFKTAAACGRTPDRLLRQGALHCRTWQLCDAGEVTLCLHPGGHDLVLAPLRAMLGR